MKRLLIAVLLLLSVNAAFAQKYEKKIAASDKSIGDPKKGINPKTWISRGELFYEIAVAPVEFLSVGMNEESYNLVMSGLEDVTAKATRETVGDKKYLVHIFDDKKVYFDKSIIQFWDILKYEAPNPWQTSYEAFIKAKNLDTKGKSAKKLKECFNSVALRVREEAFNKYHLGKYADAVELLSITINCSDEIGEADTASIYAAGIIAVITKNYTAAEKYLRRAIELGYVEGGETYASLAEALTGLEKNDESREILEKGIVLHPDNQRLIVALINSYMSAKKDPKEIIPLINKAQEKDPGNITLYVVEGNLHERLNDKENARKCYVKALEVDPGNYLGHYHVGIFHYNTGAKYNEQAIAERDEKESQRLLNLAEEELKKSLPFLEKAFELKPEEVSTIQALKEINFRFRMENDTYEKNAKKYTELLKKMGIQ
jgi:tetratricopeptide (TPR) repeat protein